MDPAKLMPPGQIPPGAIPVLLVTCGSLNPLHSAHVQSMEAAKAAVEDPARAPPDVGQAVVIGGLISPVNDAYGKPGLAPFAARRAVAEAALAGHEWLALSAWEGEQPEYVRTYRVLSHLHDAAEAHYHGLGAADVAGRLRVCFVCGADLFETFYRPGCWELSLLRRIFSEMFMAVIVRAGSRDPREVMASAPKLTHPSEPGVELDTSTFTGRVAVACLDPPNDASSTEVRRRLAAGEPLGAMVAPAAAALLTAGLCYPIPSGKAE